MSASNKYVVFLAGEEEYAIPIEAVLSIEKPAAVTSVPHHPVYVEGMAKVRNELMPLINVNKVLFPRKHLSGHVHEQRWIALRAKSMHLGLVVQAVREILDFTNVDIKQIGLSGVRKTEYIQGVACIGSRLITLVDPQKFISSLDALKELQDYIYSHQS